MRDFSNNRETVKITKKGESIMLQKMLESLTTLRWSSEVDMA